MTKFLEGMTNTVDDKDKGLRENQSDKLQDSSNGLV
jgi:hypothetical protein